MNLEYFFNIIDTRKTNRKYGSGTPSIEDIKRIIDSARMAPSAMNTQNWRFIAIFNQDVKEKMAQEVEKVYERLLASELDEETKATIGRYQGHATFFTKAPVVIAVIMTLSGSFFEGILEKAGYSEDEIKLMRPDSQLLSIGGAVENMALTAHALGLGSCWMVAPVLAQEGFKKVLNLDPKDKIVTLLTIGKPADTEGRRAPKKSLEEVMEIVK